MFGTPDRNREKGLLAVLVGAGVGLTAAAIVLWRRRRPTEERLRAGRLKELEERALMLLREDASLAEQPIDVAAVADGIIELSGAVEADPDADRAVEVVQRVPGVHTVLNRLDLIRERAHLAENQRRGVRGAGETHWYGGRVGMGRRRQSERTDPGRPSDRVPMVERALGTDRAVENASDPMDKIPTAVQGHSSKPAGATDRGGVWGMSHRGTGNVQEAWPEGGGAPRAHPHENVKPGTELSLEESGLERKLHEGGEDRG